MKRFNTTSHLAAVAASALALTGLSANAATVWNVNIGRNIDGFDGAAPENTAGSTWNSVTTNDFTGMPLADSTNSTAAGVTLDLSGGSYADFAGVTGPDIFDEWTKGVDNSTTFSLTIGGLSPTATYDIVIYSDWFWHNGDAQPVTQIIGTGLTGTAYVNRDLSDGSLLPTGTVGPLLEDPNPADVDLGTATNWHRITGLTPDASGDLGFSLGGANTPFNGFQLVDTIPEPSSAALLGLGGLALLRRRRK